MKPSHRLWLVLAAILVLLALLWAMRKLGPVPLRSEPPMGLL